MYVFSRAAYMTSLCNSVTCFTLRKGPIWRNMLILGFLAYFPLMQDIRYCTWYLQIENLSNQCLIVSFATWIGTKGMKC